MESYQSPHLKSETDPNPRKLHIYLPADPKCNLIGPQEGRQQEGLLSRLITNSYFPVEYFTPTMEIKNKNA